jgi:hypothetical protein
VGLRWRSAWSEEALAHDPSDEGLPALSSRALRVARCIPECLE